MQVGHMVVGIKGPQTQHREGRAAEGHVKAAACRWVAVGSSSGRGAAGGPRGSKSEQIAIIVAAGQHQQATGSRRATGK